MNALLTSTSPPFEPGCQRRLVGSVMERGAVSAADRDQMFNLLSAYFTGTRRDQFEADLAEKDAVILLRDSATGSIQGFSTFLRLDGEDLAAFYSGDTIVAREYWGESLLSRLWSRTVFAEADRIRAARPTTRVYWLLICSGYKTWRFLPVFFRRYWPNAGGPTPASVQRILDDLGSRRFGAQYANGVVRFRHPMPLRGGIAEVTEQRLRDPRVAFFARMNPGHAAGDELVCLTEISRENLTPAGERMLGES
ncbi:MAG TPA: hypothetical protein VL285_22630 [Bryobacteraceae bacterium]|nr:hypothetical protein [Bryobacteraceae bacterium]